MTENSLGCLCHGVEALDGVFFVVKLRQQMSQGPQREEPPVLRGVQTPQETWREETVVVGWQQKIFSQIRERGVYVQPLEAQDQQLCPRLVAYQQQLLQEGLSGEVEQQESLLKTPPTSIYTYTDGDIKETLPFLLLKAQQKGLKHPAFPECLQQALVAALFPLEPLADSRQKIVFFIMAQLGEGG
ncbi:hypothetical protein, conserved [Eimeria acervulina]|uniref:Uncharacterized protein n=1 Tax=Eimeria acervulina TaxID=5801 RepID=U6GY34_EIMAC|nr:hypothetical protein, conserved [Eimeria acervulina]CDI84143.1 hypothetical protein, conserved [Eimeria acervulina]